MDNILDFDDFKLDESNDINENLISDSTEKSDSKINSESINDSSKIDYDDSQIISELKDKEMNIETVTDSSEIDYGNLPINTDIYSPTDENQRNMDNDDSVVIIDSHQSEDNQLHEKQSESSPVKVMPNSGDINNTIPVDKPVIESDNSSKNSSKTQKSDLGIKADPQATTGSKCEVCQENVYPMEKVILDSKIYHQNCFRCCKCKKALSPTVVSKSNGYLFCKPHYIELFRMRGKYDDIDINKYQVESADKTSDNLNSSGSNITAYQMPEGITNADSHSSTIEKKDKTVSAKDLAKRFQESTADTVQDNAQRKPPIDIGVRTKVSDARHVWVEGHVDKEPDFKRRNSNNNYTNELDNVKEASKGSVKNLKAKFEVQN